MGYWEGLDREEARRVAALPWYRRWTERAISWGLPMLILAVVIGLVMWAQ